MSAIKNNLDRFPDTQAFDQGESFGRHVARQELLPLLKALAYWAATGGYATGRETEAELLASLAGLADSSVVFAGLAEVIADIERPPVTPKPTTPTDDESIPF